MMIWCVVAKFIEQTNKKMCYISFILQHALAHFPSAFPLGGILAAMLSTVPLLQKTQVNSIRSALMRAERVNELRWSLEMHILARMHCHFSWCPV